MLAPGLKLMFEVFTENMSFPVLSALSALAPNSVRNCWYELVFGWSLSRRFIDRSNALKSAPSTASDSVDPLEPNAPYLASIRINSALYPLLANESAFRFVPNCALLEIVRSVRIDSATLIEDSKAAWNPPTPARVS